MSDRALEEYAVAGLAVLRERRAAGDKLGAELAEYELNRTLDAIAARKGPGAHQEPRSGRRATRKAQGASK